MKDKISKYQIIGYGNYLNFYSSFLTVILIQFTYLLSFYLINIL